MTINLLSIHYFYIIRYKSVYVKNERGIKNFRNQNKRNLLKLIEIHRNLYYNNK